MIELRGSYNCAKIFTDLVDNESIAQVINLLNQEFTTGSKIRMMPDIHAGAGCTIGTTMTISDKIVPNLVGVDIGCGMHTIKLKEKYIEFEKLDKLIRDKIPSGFNIRNKVHTYAEKSNLNDLYCLKYIDLEKAEKSIGTLGGGNHFIECDKDDEGNLYIVIHTGSRHLGLEVANYYQREGYDRLNKSSKQDIDNLIAELKAKNKANQIENKIKTLKNTKRTSVPKNLAYVEGDLFDAYIHDMKIIQHFAELNRNAIADEIIRGMHLNVTEKFSTIHNYIDTDAMILRKGAVSAQKGETLLIPINMRDGSLICIGKGNPNWNYSAPHGAGRLMSRSEARDNISMSDFKSSMEGIYTTSVNAATIDESPMAYKPIESIINNISETADIVNIIKPIYNFKAN